MVSVSLTGKPTKRHRRFYLILIVAVLTLAIIIGIALFLLGIGNTNYGPGPVNIEVTTDKPFYMQGEEVNFTIYVNNPHDWPVEYPWLVEYIIEKDFLDIDGVSVNIDFAPGRITTFPSHSRTLYGNMWHWDQKMYVNKTFTREQVQLGNYTLTVSFDGRVDYGDSGNCTFEIKSKP